MANEFIVEEYSTFYKIPKIDGISYNPLTRNLSILNYYTQIYDPYGYKRFKTHYRCMKIPKGMLISSLRDCGVYPKLERRDDFPLKKRKPFNMKNQPKDDMQKSVIRDIINLYKGGDSRAIISLKTGQGKTYVATNIIQKLGVKALIMVKSTELKKQWIQSFNTHTDCKEVFAVDRVQDLVDLLENSDLNPDIVICTHRSMSIFMNDIGTKEFGLLLIKLGIGIKVYDEFDLENASMFNMDMASSIKYNLYLSATDYKSSRSENYIFKRIFMNVFNVGKEFETDTKRNALFLLYKSYPTRKEFGKCMQYSPQGMVFSYTKYYEYITDKFPFRKILKNLWDTFIKTRYKSKLKTVFFIGRKTTALEFKRRLLEVINVKEDEISILNSDTPKNEREDAKNKYLIISTSNSLGRGIDLKGLDTVVDFETRNSRSATSQVVGRVSRTGMKNVGTYIQLVDLSFPIVKKNYYSKKDKEFFDQFFTDIKEIENNDEEK